MGERGRKLEQIKGEKRLKCDLTLLFFAVFCRVCDLYGMTARVVLPGAYVGNKICGDEIKRGGRTEEEEGGKKIQFLPNHEYY